MINTLRSNRSRLIDILDNHPELRIPQEKYNINVTSNSGNTLSPQETFERYRNHDGAGKAAHLYFHVPFCDYICAFCNYVKKLLPDNGRRDETLDRWTKALIGESNWYLERVPWLTRAIIESLFLGGGTAAILKETHLKKLIDHVRTNYLLSEDCELTLEGNPDNFADMRFVEATCRIGFNRFSLGVQSFQEQVTHFSNRQHSPEMSRQAIKNLKATGHPFNVDIMFGLPYQTPETVRNDLQILGDMGVPTITIYRFRNVDREKMGIGNRSAWNVPKVRDKLHEASLFPTLEQTYEMREQAIEVLLAYGYRPSPCGWWSLPNTYPDGNIPSLSRNKWQRYDSMIAFGPGAYGWLTGDGSRVLQTHNDTHIAGHLRKVEEGQETPLASGRLLEGHQAVSAALGFAFKAYQPISIQHFKEQFQVDLDVDQPYQSIFAELADCGFVERTFSGNAWQPTLDGEAVHEEIISIYLHERIGQMQAGVCHK